MSRKVTRRDFLKASGALSAALMIGSVFDTSVSSQVYASTLDEIHTAIPRPPREPMDTEIRNVEGTNVLFQYGQPVPSFDTWTQSQSARQYLGLDGTWRFAFDPDDEGVTAKWFAADFDDSSWRDVEVPLPWDLYDTPDFGTYDGSHFGEGTAFRDGYAWYRRHLSPGATWKNRFIRLNCLGVHYMCWVYVNGQLAGQHEGGHTPFAIDVSPYLRPGRDNLLVIRVYRRPDYSSYTEPNPTRIEAETEVPFHSVDYWPYAGLTRSLYLESTSQVTVSKLLTATGDRMLTVRAVLYNHGEKPARRQLEFDPGEDAGGKVWSREVTLDPGQVRVVRADLPISDARWWSPTSPTLYELTATLYKGLGEGQLDQNGTGSIDDSLSVQYGMRTVAVENGRLTLNGEPILLKGVNWHEETTARGRSMTIDEYDTELGHVLDLNANFIRNCVYNRHPYVYDYSDAHGICVLDDTDNMWMWVKEEQLQTESYGLSRAMAATMAWNQINHPSVIMWSLQNESEIGSDSSVYRAWLADMKQAVKSLDVQDRPVTWASNTSWDPAFDLADVVGFNEYFGYFYGTDSNLGPTLDAVHSQYPAKPILITENGTWSFYGNHGSPDKGGTEEWQAAHFSAHWDQVVARESFMAGYTFWLLKDYKERMNYNQQYNGISEMGMLTFDTESPRLVYNTFRDAENPVS